MAAGSITRGVADVNGMHSYQEKLYGAFQGICPETKAPKYTFRGVGSCVFVYRMPPTRKGTVSRRKMCKKAEFPSVGGASSGPPP